MTVRNLATLDRDIFQPLGRLLQEAFADGLIATGTMRISKTVAADPGDGFSNGQFQYITILDCALVNTAIVGAEIRLLFAAGCAISMPGAVNPVLRLRIDEVGSDQPNLDGGDVAAISCEYYLDETGGAPRDASIIDVVAGAFKWHYLLRTQNAGDCGESAHSASGTKVVGFDSDSLIKKIPVKLGNEPGDYYILAGKAMAEVTPN